jgi:membrane-associated phospholipid phosphatase
VNSLLSRFTRFIDHLQTGISIKERLVCTVSMYLLFCIAYLAANRFIDMRTCHDISTPVDKALPFMPYFIYPYSFIYIFSMLPSLICENRTLYFRAAIGFALMIIISATIFVLFPVSIPRAYELPAGFTGWVFSQLDWIDNPVCGFPSLHVGLTLLATFTVFRENRIFGWVCVVFAVLTVLSTLLTKQHVLWDVVGGAVMAVSVDVLILRNWISYLIPLEYARQELNKVKDNFKF